MIPLSTAITDSGAAQKIADLLVDAVGDAGPTVLLVALFVVTVMFGQLISNTATALVMIPVAVSAAEPARRLGPAGADERVRRASAVAS